MSSMRIRLCRDSVSAFMHGDDGSGCGRDGEMGRWGGCFDGKEGGGGDGLGSWVGGGGWAGWLVDWLVG